MNLSNKEIAVAFLRLTASNEVREAYALYVHLDFIHHNPYFLGDRESLLTGMEENATLHPEKTLDVKFALEDGDMVSVYTHIKQKVEERGYAVFHLFRFVDGKIIEMWDVSQEIPFESKNENGMF